MPRVIDRSALTSKSQVTLPKRVRELLGVGPGDQVRFEIDGEVVRIIPVRSRLEENFGRVKPKTRPEDFKKIREEVAKKIAEEAARKAG